MTAMELEPGVFPGDELSDREHIKLALAYLVRDIGEVKRSVERNQIDVDYYLSDNGSSSTGIIKPVVNVNKPWICESFLCTWDPTSAFVTLTIGDRVIKFPPGLGAFTASNLNIQVQRDDTVSLAVTIGKACHIEVMGTADSRKIDRS